MVRRRKGVRVCVLGGGGAEAIWPSDQQFWQNILVL